MWKSKGLRREKTNKQAKMEDSEEKKQTNKQKWRMHPFPIQSAWYRL